MPKADNDYVNVKEAAEILGCSVQNIYKLMTQGKLRFRMPQPFAIERESVESYARDRHK